jgi:Fe-S-cluster containining protein
MMKMLSEKQGLVKLQKLKDDYRGRIAAGFEHKAKSCLTCKTQGACCLDAHFVNVHVTRLEAVSIRETIGALPLEKQSEIHRRVEETVEKYGLRAEGDTFAKTYACPLFEKGTGCLVHRSGKPLPCIQHACYENREDLPPDELLTEQEGLVENLNKRIYGSASWMPLPLWLADKG